MKGIDDDDVLLLAAGTISSPVHVRIERVLR